jgi:ketosteroid isomerase-like protein
LVAADDDQEVSTMSETHEFLAATMARIHDAEIVLHNGDAGPRKAMWSRTEPVTLFGAAMSGAAWAEIEPIFDRLGSLFSNCTSYRNQVVAAGTSGDLAYTVAFEHITASVNGEPPRPYTLRVTTIFRREGGEWKVVHRHGDSLASKAAGELMDRLAVCPADTDGGAHS